VTVCKQKDDIDRTLNRGLIQTAFINRYVDPYDYTDPIKHYLDGFYGNVEANLNKIMFTHHKQIKVQGLIFKEIKEEKSFKSDYMITDTNLLAEDQIIYTVHVISSFNLQVVYRQYMKLQLLPQTLEGY
jgi:hypothetical protein